MMGGSDALRLLDVGRLPSEGQVALTPAQTAGDPASFSNNDDVNLFAGALYLQATTHWTPWFRSVLGLRDDYQHGTDDDLLAALHADGRLHQRRRQRPEPAAAQGQPDLHAERQSRILPVRRRRLSQRRSARGQSGPERRSRPSRIATAGEAMGRRSWRAGRPPRRTSPSPSRSTICGSSPRRSSIPDVGRTRRGRPATLWLRNQHDLPDSPIGSNSTAASRAITRASPSPSTTGPAISATYITDAPVAAGSLALYLHDLGPWSGGLDLSLSRQLSALLGALRQFRRGARFSRCGDLLRQCADRAWPGQRQGVRTAQPRCALRLPAGLDGLARHLQPAQHPRGGGRVLVRRPAAIRDRDLSRTDAPMSTSIRSSR